VTAPLAAPPRDIELRRERTHFLGRFTAMASPCEVLIDTDSQELAQRIVAAAANCAWRIERKFSRYRDDSVIQKINNSAGEPVAIDDETANLIDFAATLHQMSSGAFDITSGVLRKAWRFDGGDVVPSQAQLDGILPAVGWHKVAWKRPTLRLRPGMQLDLGGIGKEYAVDCAVGIADTIAPGTSCVVNFGGDVAVRHRRRDAQAWRIGIERTAEEATADRIIELSRGALATSGDSRRFVSKDGVRYSHILDARTGWSVRGAPRSITVLADTCTQAGTWTTLAMLQGPNAESFLREAGVRYWIQ
jgi:thiamine biosynthesis lipoprotein